MSVRLRVILLITLIIVLIGIIRQIKQKKLDLKYTLSWFFLVVAIMILDIFPQLLELLTAILGIASPVNMIFFCGFGFSLIIIYTLTVAISRMADEIKCLAQKVALLEKENQKLNHKESEEK